MAAEAGWGTLTPVRGSGRGLAGSWAEGRLVASEGGAWSLVCREPRAVVARFSRATPVGLDLGSAASRAARLWTAEARSSMGISPTVLPAPGRGTGPFPVGSAVAGTTAPVTSAPTAARALMAALPVAARVGSACAAGLASTTSCRYAVESERISLRVSEPVVPWGEGAAEARARVAKRHCG